MTFPYTAEATIGPLNEPNRTIYVEVLSAIPGMPGFFLARDKQSDTPINIHHLQLTPSPYDHLHTSQMSTL